MVEELDLIPPMTTEQAETLKRLAEAAYEREAFKPNLTRAEADGANIGIDWYSVDPRIPRYHSMICLPDHSVNHDEPCQCNHRTGCKCDVLGRQ